MQIVKLNFLTFDVELANTCSKYDTLRVYDGVDNSAPSLATLCGQTVPGDIVSTNSYLFVHFKSDNSITQNGFQIKYTAILRSKCYLAENIPIDTYTIEFPNMFACFKRCLHIASSEKICNFYRVYKVIYHGQIHNEKSQVDINNCIIDVRTLSPELGLMTTGKMVVVFASPRKDNRKGVLPDNFEPNASCGR